MKQSTPNEWLDTRFDFIKRTIVYPKYFDVNLRQLLRCFSCTDKSYHFILSLLTAVFIQFPVADHESSWEEQYKYFRSVFYDGNIFRPLIDQWPCWNKHPLCLDLFQMLSSSFMVQVSTRESTPLNIDSCKIPIIDWIIGFEKNANRETRTNAGIEDRHIQLFTDIAHKIYMPTYRNEIFDYWQHRDDCYAINSTINILFSYPRSDILYANDPLSAIINVCEKAIDNPQSHIQPVVDRYTHRRELEYYINNAKRFIELCKGIKADDPSNIPKHHGRLIGACPIQKYNDNLAIHKITLDCQNDSRATYLHPISHNTDINFNVMPKTNKTRYKIIGFLNPFKELIENTFSGNNLDVALSNDDIDVLDQDDTLDEHEEIHDVDIAIPDNKDVIHPAIALKKKPNIFTGRKYIKTEADSNHVPSAILLPFLIRLYNKSPLYHAYAWLCTATGIGWKRLQRLTISNDISLLNEDNVIFNQDKGSLIYKTINGAKDFQPNDNSIDISADVVTLQIPLSIAQIIIESGKLAPFAEV